MNKGEAGGVLFSSACTMSFSFSRIPEDDLPATIIAAKCDACLKTEQREHRLCSSPVNVADNVDQPLGTLRLPPLGARVALNQSVGPVLEPECSSSMSKASVVTASVRNAEWSERLPYGAVRIGNA